MKFKKPRWFISLYTGWLQNIYFLGLQCEKWHVTLGTLRINFASITTGILLQKIALAIVAPLWNKPPCNVRQAESLKKFNRLLHGK